MLTESERELITAAVDGDLSPDRQAEFRRLISESGAACALYQYLCRDRARLRNLPRVSAPPHLLAAVTSRVTPPPLPPISINRPAPPRRSARLPLSLAASLLLFVGGSSFLYFQARDREARSVEQAQTLPKLTQKPEIVINDRATPDVDPRPPVREITPDPRPSRTDFVRGGTPASPVVETAPLPHASNQSGDVFTSPVGPDGTPFSGVQVRVPLLLPVSDLAGDDGQRRVATELGRDPAVRIDLFVNDPVRAADALVSAAGKAVKLPVLIDTVTHERLRKRLPFGWVVVTDALTPEEVADWLAALPAETRAGMPNVVLTGAAHFVTAGATEQKEWRELTGSDPAWAKPGKADVTPKNVSADTADHVAGTLLKSGNPHRQAFLATFSPREARVPAAVSKEAKLFADRRGERKPRAVSVMIVIRQSAP